MKYWTPMAMNSLSERSSRLDSLPFRFFLPVPFEVESSSKWTMRSGSPSTGSGELPSSFSQGVGST
ncbi:MAG: hypothetical protein ACK6A5_02050, partial [Flavobacteriales bacterium]